MRRDCLICTSGPVTPLPKHQGPDSAALDITAVSASNSPFKSIEPIMHKCTQKTD